MAPPHYFTRRSQLPAGAHAMFTQGHGYYAGPAPGAVPPPRPKPVKPKSQSVSQVANQQVNQQLAPVLAQQGQQAQYQNQAIQNFALAMLGKLQPVAGQVGQDYDKAIGQTAALSGATADALRNANPNQQDQQLLASINAPQAQRDQVASKLADTFGGGAAALQFTQGEVPGTQLATNKAAAQSQARQLPGIAALKGQQDLSSALYQQGQARQSTLAQRPGLVQQATQNITANRTAKQARADDLYKFAVARADALEAGGQKAAADKLRTKAEYDYKYAALNSSNQRASMAEQGRNARAAASITAQNQRTAATLEAKAKAKGVNGLTANERASLRKAAAKQLDLYYYGKEPKRRFNATTQKYEKVPGTGVSGLTYGQAIKRIMSQYSMSKKDATAMANDYYAPGEFGRPAKPAPKPTPDRGFRDANLR